MNGFEDLAIQGGRWTMDDLTRLRLRAMLERDEGRRTRPYLDCCGKPWRQCTCVDKGHLTIGIGFNLDALDMPDVVMDLWCRMLVTGIEAELTTALPWVTTVDPVRYAVLIDMAYNLGVPGLLQFEKMLAAIKDQQWEKAADEMRDSVWSQQVGVRATRLERLMITGSW